jgi:hypothetical protein
MIDDLQKEVKRKFTTTNNSTSGNVNVLQQQMMERFSDLDEKLGEKANK